MRGEYHLASPDWDQVPGRHWALHWDGCTAPVSTLVKVPEGHTRHVSWASSLY